MIKWRYTPVASLCVPVIFAVLQASAASPNDIDEAMRRYAMAVNDYQNVQLTMVRTYSGEKPSQYQVLLRRDGPRLDIYESKKDEPLGNAIGRDAQYRQHAVLADEQLLIYTPSNNVKVGGSVSVEYFSDKEVNAESDQTLMRYLDYGVALIGLLPGDPPVSIVDVKVESNSTSGSGSDKAINDNGWIPVHVEKDPFTYDLWLDPDIGCLPRKIRMHAVRASESSETTTVVNITGIEYKSQHSIWVPQKAEIAVSYDVTTGQHYQYELTIAVKDVVFNPDFKNEPGAFVLDVDEPRTLVASYDAPQVPLKMVNGRVVPAVDSGVKQSIDTVIHDIRSGKYRDRVSDPTDPIETTPATIGSSKLIYATVALVCISLIFGLGYLTRRLKSSGH